ncbi:2-polyprenyl-6-methoxyphenol hydroxylase-like FAD-dependent oxidoreductase [Rhizobium sp. BK529]|uniref:FAD-dependent monooxygenase n=1 Tax=unclassified Rhizobium TaxID=2613769 RepID=UPI00104FDCD1|nr:MULTISPECIES: FAD-dependent monooxygenase [unclassified Rhizobium]MBB3589912.1 2-polyprenyl-6-methoxyphenol hydroxylase-like FAD-dependent oxidoreductase [Rhizobium sp. BK529]TCS04579.1 putative polyketide hydroxylase/tetracenomycin A2 monooxygenase-dioxygenase [Rhizobium sp. BK418]
MSTHIPVLIIGGGLTGLTAAALLARQGVGCMVVERHADTSIQYKFAGISPRSMEIFRSLGLEAEIRAKRTGDQQGGGIARARNLADPDVQWGGQAWPDASPYSPTQPATCDQHVLEPILRRCAERAGADTRFNTEFLSLEQDAAAVYAVIRNRETGKEETLVADYLIAADGANGTLREKLGIDRKGPGVLQHWMSIIFDTDLSPEIGGRPLTSCFVSDLNATITPRPGGRWLLALQYFPEKGERPEDFDRNRCRELVEKAAGRAGVKAELVDARSWEMAAFLADRFSAGRCFLIGDAAHLMPPTGAFGGNSGIHDAHNLAWKLAMVVRGEANARLLDTYDAERRPVIAATLAQALARLQQWFRDPAGRLPPAVAIVNDYDVVFGQRYDSGALVPEDGAPERAFEPVAELAGIPGTRAPHLVIERDGETLSTLDLFGRDFVLLAGDAKWRAAADRLRKDGGLPLACHVLGISGDLAPEGRWPGAYGVEESGAVLIRPDGFVAWRAPGVETDIAGRLVQVLEEVGMRIGHRDGTRR